MGIYSNSDTSLPLINSISILFEKSIVHTSLQYKVEGFNYKVSDGYNRLTDDSTDYYYKYYGDKE